MLQSKDEILKDNREFTDIVNSPEYAGARFIGERKGLENMTIEEAHEYGFNVSKTDKFFIYLRKTLKFIFVTAVIGSLFYFSYDYVSKQNIKLDTLFSKGK